MTSVLDLISATVKLEQPTSAGATVSGTGFVVAATAADGSPRLILVTANHVFARMPRDHVHVGFRSWSPEHGWRYAPVNVRIRDAEGASQWTKHPTQDVAVLELPANVTTTAVPLSELPGEDAMQKLKVEPGDQMMVLGYPRGIAANPAGFPILRSGIVASYPLSPADRYPTYLVDLDVFGGNSGGPVYVPFRGPDGRTVRVVVTGILTQQIKYHDLRLAIGNVTQADFISETVSLLGDIVPSEATKAEVAVAKSVEGAVPVAAEPVTSAQRLADAWRDFIADSAILLRRAWIVVRDFWMSFTTPDAKRVTEKQQR